MLETISYAISLFYSARNQFPFSTYGENLFLTFQNLVITFLIVLYQAPSSRQALSTSQPKAKTGIIFALTTSVIAVVLAFIPSSILSILQVLTLPLGLISKLPQIAQNARAKSTGQLSGIAVFAQVAGCLARLFTTATEVGDPILSASFALALLLNIVIGAQMLMYWDKDGVKDAPVYLGEKQTEKGNFLAPSPIATPVSTPSSPIPRAGTPQGGRKWARKVD